MMRYFCFVIISLALIPLLSACNLGVSTPAPTPDLPQIEILSPLNNQQVYEGAEFDFDIVARDSTQGIARIELYIDGVIINTASPVDAENTPVFRVAMNWRAQGIGLHVVEAIAYRPDGTRGDAFLMNIEVIARDN